MTAPWRHRLQRVVPAHFADPLGLTVRLLRSGEGAAYFAMLCAALGVVATPLDLLLAVAERRRYRRASSGTRPLLFVCGPPRSGTTIVASTLLEHLPLAYFTNWTSIFPHAPVTATRLCRGLLAARRISHRNHYGRTAHFSGPNDALYLWDRWLGRDRQRAADCFGAKQRESMRRFFDAWEEASGTALLNKCNNLNADAHLVADTLERSRFLCVERDPLQLAQSLYCARLDIHGDPTVPYGLSDPASAALDDPIESVCEQVRFHQELATRQERRIGPQRFWRVSYEDFCRDPAALVQRVERDLLGASDPGRRAIDPLVPSMQRRIAPELFEALRGGLERRRVS